MYYLFLIQSVLIPNTAGGLEADIKPLELETTALGKENAGDEASTPENLGEQKHFIVF